MGNEEVLFYITDVSGYEVFLTANMWFFNASLLLGERVGSFIQQIEDENFYTVKEDGSYEVMVELLPYALLEIGVRGFSKGEVLKELFNNVNYVIYRTHSSRFIVPDVRIRRIKNPSSLVYLVRSFGNYYKIGKTNNVDNRLRQLKTHNPEITLIGLTDLYSEELLHKKFKDYRVKGEWFIFEDRVLEKVKSYFYIL